MEEVLRSIEFNKSTIIFGFQVFQQLGTNPLCLNGLISPLSLHVALGLLFMGAKGKTREELVEGLHISDKSILTAMSFHHSICKYKSKKGLKINNKYYIQKGLVVKNRFKLIAEKIFRTEIESMNFGEKERSAQMINAWVSSKTEKPIDKAVLPHHIEDETKILIVSSITFQCNWKFHFNPENTVNSDFTTTTGETVPVSMMSHNRCSIKYREFSDLKCAVFELPFADKDFGFVIFFPKKEKGFDLLEQQLPLIDLVKYRRRMKVATVDISMPKFSIEYTARLAKPLKEMGLNLMFDRSQAEFAHIAETKQNICVGQVINKSFIEINEYGAGVTEPNDEIGVSQKTATAHSIKVNRPFLFAVVSRRHRLFFWGAVRDPSHVKCQYPIETSPDVRRFKRAVVPESRGKRKSYNEQDKEKYPEKEKQKEIPQETETSKELPEDEHLFRRSYRQISDEVTKEQEKSREFSHSRPKSKDLIQEKEKSKEFHRRKERSKDATQDKENCKEYSHRNEKSKELSQEKQKSKTSTRGTERSKESTQGKEKSKVSQGRDKSKETCEDRQKPKKVFKENQKLQDDSHENMKSKDHNRSKRSIGIQVPSTGKIRDKSKANQMPSIEGTNDKSKSIQSNQKASQFHRRIMQPR